MSEIIIPKQSGPKLNALASYAGLKNVRILSTVVNPFVGRLNQTTVKDSPIGISALGTPVYTDLTLSGCKWIDNLTGRTETCPADRFRSGAQSAITNTPQQGGFYMNLETVLMVVHQPINIVKTEIQGRNGTVKEYIGAADSEVQITGMITGRNGVYPRDEVARLKKWLDAPVAKGIVSWWLDNLGISNLVVADYDFPQTQGGYSYQIFQINAISDAPVELKITQPPQ